MTRRPLRRGRWSFEELQRLRALLPRRGVEGTAALLRRTADAVRRRALQLLRVPPRRGEWSEADEAVLMDAFGAVELRLLAVMLGRPAVEVTKKAARLRTQLRSGPWSQLDSQRLKHLYGTRSTQDLEVCFRRRATEIEAEAARLCLRKDKRFVRSQRKVSRASRAPRWTDPEIARLRALYPEKDNLQIARELGRSVVSVANKAWQLGLEKGPAVLGRIGRANVRIRFASES